MRELHPITLIIVLLACIYLFTGCIGPCADPKAGQGYYEDLYGGRPKGIGRTHSVPFSYKEQRRNPDRRSWSWTF